MQHAGWKTSEKAISGELLQDFASKSLFNTLFMMFNSRYQACKPPGPAAVTTRQRFGRMYYILEAGERINDFAVDGGSLVGKNAAERIGEREEKPDKKEVGGWAYQLIP
jgi:hypothetical protein